MRHYKERRAEKVLEQARDYIAEEKPLHAIQLYKHLMRGRYFSREAHIELADLYKYLSLLKAAENILLQFLRFNPNDGEIIYRIALIDIMQNKFIEAEQFINRALLLEPGNQLIIDLLQKIHSSK